DAPAVAADLDELALPVARPLHDVDDSFQRLGELCLQQRVRHPSPCFFLVPALTLGPAGLPVRDSAPRGPGQNAVTGEVQQGGLTFLLRLSLLELYDVSRLTGEQVQQLQRSPLGSTRRFVMR